MDKSLQMNSTFGTYLTLGEEIESVRQYLLSENERSGGKLSWELKINPALDNRVVIPKMLIRFFVETAELNPEEGTLEVLIQPTTIGILVMVSGKGIRIDRAAREHKDIEEGLRTLDEQIYLFNSLHKHSINYRFIPGPRTEGDQTGNRILISILF